MLDLYGRDFIAAWQQGLAKLRMRNLNDKPTYAALNAVAAPTSPLRLLLESIRDETALTRERADKDSKDNKQPPKPLGPQSGAPGAAIELQFRPFQLIFEGGSRSLIDAVIDNLVEINRIEQTVALYPNQQQQATTQLRTPVANLKTNALRMPRPFQEMLTAAADSFENEMSAGRAR
jgi:type VI secretion system protein ImpL